MKNRKKVPVQAKNQGMKRRSIPLFVRILIIIFAIIFIFFMIISLIPFGN